MPKIYRVMLVDGRHPKVGDRKYMLGVRIGKPPKGDVELTEKGTIAPKTGGMSVAPHWTKLPYFIIPPRLRHLVPFLKQRALGGNDAAQCWCMGEGDFIDGKINNALALHLESPTHGLIEPTNEVSIDAFQMSLAQTRNHWEIDEEP